MAPSWTTSLFETLKMMFPPDPVWLAPLSIFAVGSSKVTFPALMTMEPPSPEAFARVDNVLSLNDRVLAVMERMPPLPAIPPVPCDND